MQAPIADESIPLPVARWGKVIDNTRCIGCHACTVACKMEHQVPLGVTRTFVKQVEVGVYPEVRRHFQVTRCNQCEDPPCVAICPTAAMFKREDGIIDFDRDACIGCKACIAACPYDAIYIDPVSRSAEKCNFCAHRIDMGMEPACVVVCPERAIIVGDLNDPRSEVSQIVARQKVDVRRPEKGTDPKLFYVEANAFTLVPGAAAVPPFFPTAEQQMEHPSGEPVLPVAAALLQYDIPKKIHWGWMVSAYTWTKAVAAGVFGLGAAFALGGGEVAGNFLAALAFVAGLFLLLTGGLLVGDLSHPERFLYILIRPQWRSWLARGAFVIAGYGLVLAIAFFVGLAGGRLAPWLAVPALPLAALTAAYTGFLFAQARGRDLWQSALLPLHFLVKAVMAGAGALALLGLVVGLPEGLPAWLHWTLLGSLAMHALLLLSEMAVPHPTRDARRAAHNLMRGAYRQHFQFGFWFGVLGALLLALVGWAAAAGAVALIGLLAGEHALVQAGQSVAQS